MTNDKNVILRHLRRINLHNCIIGFFLTKTSRIMSPTEGLWSPLGYLACGGNLLWKILLTVLHNAQNVMIQ